MPKLIFVTVGTSAIDNCQSAFPSKGNTQTPVEAVSDYLRKQPEKAYKELLNPAPANADINKSLVYNLQRELRVFEGSIGTKNMLNRSRKVSAEVASLLVMSKEPDVGAFDKNDEIYLIPSETDVGIVCAEANCAALHSRFPDAQIERTPSLEGIRFAGEAGEKLVNRFVQEGLASLEKVVRERIDAFKSKHGHAADFIMDVTGGFKGLILFAPILCKRYTIDKLFYFYQEAARPIRLNRSYYLEKFSNDESPLNSDSNLPPMD